jgi:hypothetical protein
VIRPSVLRSEEAFSAGTRDAGAMNDQLLASWDALLAEQRELHSVYLHVVGSSKNAEILGAIKALVRSVAVDIAALEQICPGLARTFED